MLKKAIPLFLVSGLVLTGCNMNDKVVPDKNETPMENRDWTPDVNNGQTGPNLDGLDKNTDMNGKSQRGGIIRDENYDNRTNEMNGNNDDGTTLDGAIEDNSTNNRNNMNR
ncbi:hypothetical protein [Sporosarcina sp. FA9]|uniref:hypothetical protein n=1 Tax=Sporosarcina sp. FA9 TaxID=3413030 RepID=UPI003F65FEBA